MAASPSNVAEGAVLLGAEEAFHRALLEAGALCGGCGWPAAERMRLYLAIKPAVREGQPTINVLHRYACDRDECDFEEKVRKDPDTVAVREMTPPWRLLDEAGEERPLADLEAAEREAEGDADPGGGRQASEPSPGAEGPSSPGAEGPSSTASVEAAGVSAAGEAE